MGKQPNSYKKLLPVLLCYIVMGFVDVVGVSTGYAQRDFDLSPTLAQLLPSMVFIWFLLLSVPIGILQNNYGKRRMLIIGVTITALGMFIPFVLYTYVSLLACFVMLGIGNTIIQVSSNPLLQDVVSKDRFSSFMSLSQFIKAISSLLGPIIVTYMVVSFANWKLIFLIYGILSILTGLWLGATPINENKTAFKATIASSLGLLKNPFILAMVVAIFLIVGLDVGMNTNIQNLLMLEYGISLENASLGISLYFAALMVSRFIAAIVLTKVRDLDFLLWCIVLTIVFLIALLLAPSTFLAYTFIFLIGLSSANFFPLIFSMTINLIPERANEISALMIMAVVGGAIIPPLMGVLNNYFGISAGFMLLLLSVIYLLYSYFLLNRRIKSNSSNSSL